MRQVRWIAAAVLMACALVRPAGAQSYPAQNVTFVVSFAAGGIADVIARLVALRLGERFGSTVVVENRAGAGGNLAARAVATSAADGYTVLATTASLAVNDTASRNKGYSASDLRAVAIVAYAADVLAVHPSNPARDLTTFLAKGKVDSFTYGSAGLGTGPHIGAEYFFREIAKVKAVHVPFAGGAPATQAVIGNHVESLWLTLPTVVPPLQEGRLRGLGVSNATRNPALPDVPTLAEMGFPGFQSLTWVGFFVPASTPDAVVVKLNSEINAVMQTADSQAKLKAIGFDALIQTPAEAADYFKRDIANWGKMTKAIGFSTD
jgi:tripartite-type tricarboxylate transporter receptor subunit TctC